jgi:polyisoprenoid-binding protein YceI
MQVWNIDTSHSSVRFHVRHLMFAKVHGAFRKFTGQIELDEKTGEFVRVHASIDATSIDTSEEQRDAHLRSADFFDVEKHPKLEFTSTKIEKTSSGYALHGDLTLRGVTKSITLEVESLGRVKDPWGNTRVGFSAKGAIKDRKEFGLVWNQTLDAGGIAVGDKVEIEIEVEAVAPRAQVAPSTEARA